MKARFGWHLVAQGWRALKQCAWLGLTRMHHWLQFDSMDLMVEVSYPGRKCHCCFLLCCYSLLTVNGRLPAKAVDLLAPIGTNGLVDCSLCPLHCCAARVQIFPLSGAQPIEKWHLHPSRRHRSVLSRRAQGVGMGGWVGRWVGGRRGGYSSPFLG